LQKEYLFNIQQQKLLEKKLQEIKKPKNLQNVAEKMNLKREGHQYAKDH
jgi:DNA-binding phage protein